MSLPYFPCYIEGAFADCASTIESVDPATGETWAHFGAANAEETSGAVEAAHRAFQDPSWSRMTASDRGKLLYRLANLLAEHGPRLADLETRDTGKIIRETRAQIAYIADYYRYFAGLADKVEGSHLPIDKADMEVYTRREPIGVVAAIVPWNSQLFLSAVKLGPALAAGCTMVLKTSEDGAAALLEFARLIHETGFPNGVINVICGRGEDCGRALTSHPLVAKVAFTGGPSTARNVIRNTAENLAATTLELGGKSPVIVFADADLNSAANAVVAGIFAAAGQSCVAGSRLIVETTIQDEFLAILTAKAQSIRIGAPDDPETEMGPVATRRQLDHIEAVVASSVRAGARVVTGGKRPAHMSRGFYYEPTILSCLNLDTPCMQQELFGPVLSVTGFASEADAIVRANATRFGLASGVFTRDLARAHRMIQALRTGMVWVNTYRAISPMAPFGGYGMSGYGREGGSSSIHDYTRTKSVWIRTSDEPMPDPFVMR
ncbi:MAG: aldehyde dehydrogenase [Hyphomicrobiales bacterium]|nr:aldehyde dehydrogenase [Hyphomicrobiales bacterium]